MFPSILIVDDKASILKSLSGILSDEGFETITVSNGYEALKTLESKSPDIVLFAGSHGPPWEPIPDRQLILQQDKFSLQKNNMIISGTNDIPTGDSGNEIKLVRKTRH